MEKMIPLSDIKANLEALSQLKPTTEQDIEEWLGNLDLTFKQTVEAMNNIFDNKTLENDLQFTKSI